MNILSIHLPIFVVCALFLEESIRFWFFCAPAASQQGHAGMCEINDAKARWRLFRGLSVLLVAVSATMMIGYLMGFID